MTEPLHTSADPGQTPVELELASPLTLLIQEEGHADRQAEEALFLSFTADLGFFEAVALGVTQACGARVCVVGDAAMNAPDPRAVRRAGRTYLPGNAVCEGAFHPKLVAVAGPRRATVAIGSGNTTLAGWQANAELWTVLRATQEQAPAALTELAGWLHGLPGRIRFSAEVPQALRRLADTLQTLCEQAEPVHDEVRLVSSSGSAIIDQLPTGPAEELAVCAPFHDVGAAALRRLIERFQPQHLIISYQPGLTQFDGPALADLAAELNTEIRYDDESRYRHGKLIEWVTGGQRYALTGSPNLSTAALLTSLEDGGNCELGVITPISSSRMPCGTVVPPATIRSLRFSIRHHAGQNAPLLLGATRVEHGLHVMFARPLPVNGHLELSPAIAPPDTWERVGEVAAGAAEALLTVPADGGSRLRLTTSIADIPRYSNVVHVVDPVPAQSRYGVATRHVPTTQPNQLFGDQRLAERFLADLTALSTALPRSPAAARAAASDDGSTRADRTTADADRADSGWEQYLDECAGRIGTRLLRFALGLPDLPDEPQTTHQAVLPVSWDEHFADDTEIGLEDDTADIAADQQAPTAPPAPPDLRHTSPDVRRRYRQWADRLTQAAPRLGPPEKMLVTRLLLWTAAAGAWDRDDQTWLDLLADTTIQLAATAPPAEAEPQVASLAAVALAVLRVHAPRHIATPQTLAFTRAASHVDYLLPAADPAYIEQYSQLLQTAFGPSVSPDAIQALAAEIVQADPIADAVWTLVEQGHDAHRHGTHLLHVTGTFNNPLLAALQAVAAAQDADIVGAWATSGNDPWALAIWRRPDLFTIDARTPTALWRHYQLTGLSSPRSLAAQRSLDAARRVAHGPLSRPFPQALAALDALGLPHNPQPPDRCAEAD